MAIIVYNKHVEEHIGDNVFYIGRGSIYGNPYTHIKNKETKADVIVENREQAIDCYRVYFKQMYESKEWFKEAVDELYVLYKNGIDIYLECYCMPQPCHGEVIKEFLVSKLMKEKINKILEMEVKNEAE